MSVTKLLSNTAAGTTSFSGEGLPEGEVPAGPGTLYQNRSGSGHILWIKEAGQGASGWIPVPTGSEDASDKVTKGDLILSVRDYGASGDGIANDTAAINSALSALSTAGGGELRFPPGTYMTDGGHVLPAYTHIQGAEPAARYWGYNASAAPPVSCALKLRTGTAATALLSPGASNTASSLRNIVLLGNNVGSGIHGINFAVPSTEHNFVGENVAIIGFTGDGIRGRLFAQRWHHLYVGGCHGWGLNCTGSTNWTDVWFTACIINGNKLGGVNIDSTGASGEVHFADSRFERSGWDPGNPTTPVGAGAPGIRLRGTLKDSSFVGGGTDANSGFGVDIDRAAGRQLHHLQFVGMRFKRDGFGDMASLGEYAAVRVRGITNNSVDFVTFAGCFTAEGKADDSGASPAYVHPKYGLWSEITAYVSWHGGGISSDHDTPLYGGAAGWVSNWRPVLSIPGPAGQSVLPVWDGAGGRPAAVLKGQVGLREDTGNLEYYTGSAWRTITSS